jgi:hypothetical protein
LAKSGSARRAAQSAEVGIEQIDQWKHSPDFQSLINEHRSVDLMLTISALLAAGPIAAQTLADAASPPPKRPRGRPKKDEEPSIARAAVDNKRLRAARAVLDNIFRFSETIEFMERIKALEERINREVLPQLPSSGVLELPVHDAAEPELITDPETVPAELPS